MQRVDDGILPGTQGEAEDEEEIIGKSERGQLILTLKITDDNLISEIYYTTLTK